MPSLSELFEAVGLADFESACQFIIERMEDVAFVIDLDLKNLYFSPSIKRILGIDPEDRINREALTFLSPRSREAVREALRREIQKEGAGADPDRIFLLNLEYSKKGGPWRNFEVSFRPLRHRGGKLKAFLGLAREKTEQQVIEEALRESERLWAQVITSLPDATMVINLAGRVIAWNQAMEALTGVTAREMLGQGDYAYAVPFYGERRPVMVDLVINPDDHYLHRYLDVHWEGDRLVSETFLPDFRGRGPSWFRNNACRLYDHKGNLLGAIETIREFTERKMAEEALQESRERYQALFEGSTDAVYVHRIAEDGKPGKFIEVNEVACRMLGYSREEFQAMHIGNIDAPESNVDVREKVKELLAGRPALFEQSHVAKDGSRIPVEVHAHIVDFEGRKAILSTVRDISERQRAEEERLELERRLLHAQKLESLGVLAGGIAHDFNNLLAAILGNLELALLELPALSPSRPPIDEAVRAAHRAADLTRQMLAYSGKGRFLIKELDINELVRENTNMLKAAISKKVVLKLELGPNIPLLKADPGQIQQIIMNLITNGSEALGDRTGEVTLTTGLQVCAEACLSRSRLTEKPEPGPFIYLDVADTGSGMDEGTLSRLFDPFFTTKFTGRGLGLAAVSGIVRAHRGAILVDSKPGQGTAVRVLLPASTADPAADRKTAVPAGASSFSSPTAARGLVLIVDDEEMIRRFCQSAVERFGYRTIMAADGVEAIERFREKPGEVTCVLLDLTMPRMDGVATFKHLKRIRPDVRVVLSSGYSEQEAVKRFSDYGLAGFIQKPYSLASLEKILSSAAG